MACLCCNSTARGVCRKSKRPPGGELLRDCRERLPPSQWRTLFIYTGLSNKQWTNLHLLTRSVASVSFIFSTSNGTFILTHEKCWPASFYHRVLSRSLYTDTCMVYTVTCPQGIFVSIQLIQRHIYILIGKTLCWVKETCFFSERSYCLFCILL